MGMILRIASSRIVGQGDIVGRSGYFSLNLSANSVMRGRLDARRTLKSLVADLRLITIEVKQRAKEKAWQQEQEERWQRIKARADSLKLADEKQKHQTEEQKKQAFIRKYGQRYGSLIYHGKLELGMTQQMCQEVIDIKSYDIGKSMRSGHRVETWTFNKDKQDMQVAAAMTQLSGEEAMALALLMGFADSVGASTPKYSVLVFTDGKLTSLY